MICPLQQEELSIFHFDSCLSNDSKRLDFDFNPKVGLFIPHIAIHFLTWEWHLIVLVSTSSQLLTCSQTLELDICQDWMNFIYCLNRMVVLFSFLRVLPERNVVCSLEWSKHRRKKKQSSNRLKWSVLCDDIFGVGRLQSSYSVHFRFVFVVFFCGLHDHIEFFLSSTT